MRRAGHEAHVPDLYEGHVFDSLDEGLAYAKETGFEEILERGVRAADGLPPGLVYAGFSLGVMPAQKLAQTRAGARGALLFHACIPTSEFGADWPAGEVAMPGGWTLSMAWMPIRCSWTKATSTRGADGLWFCRVCPAGY